jgi:coenzyme F420-reducing hydrogenase beta subunit
MKIETIDETCTGCSLCENSCPAKAITMIEDKEGFMYPKIDHNLCTGCGLCDKKCPSINKYERDIERRYYYGYHKNDKVRYESSSGGAFNALATSILEDNGVVFGAVFDANTKSVMHVSTNTHSLMDIQKSKYGESDLKNSFEEVKKHLQNNKKVLFCSTPCHVRGLYKFVGEDKNLITCDFICHGVPSRRMLREQLEFYEKQTKEEIRTIDFRDKKYGWTGNYIYLKISSKSKTYRVHHSCDEYYNGFMSENAFLRKSCYECECSSKSSADITLADFWGYNKYNKDLNDEKGLSLIITNTNQGELLIKSIEQEFNLNDLEEQYAEYVFKRKEYSAHRNTRDKFYDMYYEKGFRQTARAIYYKKKKKDIHLFNLKQSVKRIFKINTK